MRGVVLLRVQVARVTRGEMLEHMMMIALTGVEL